MQDNKNIKSDAEIIREETLDRTDRTLPTI